MGNEKKGVVFKMNVMYKRLSIIVTALMILGLAITGCTSQASNIGLAREDDRNTIGTDFVVAEVGSYDSADTAVIVSIDYNASNITFMNIKTGKQYTLSYDGTTYVKDKYEGPMSMSQIREGDIVDVTFLKSKKRLASVQLSPSSWVYDNVGNYDLGGINKTATIGSNTYSLPDEVVVLSEGKRTEVMEVINKDVLTVSGIDHTIYSINVQRGHGYLRLSNEQALVGGWIEVGNAVVQQITDDMLLAVPEGSYQVLLSSDNARCVKEVTIERNKEVVLDVSDLEIIQEKKGKILISVDPSDATVIVDGEIIDISEEVELDYGIHQIRLEAEGYQTMTKYIQVGSEYASISFIMEEGETEENSVSDNNSIDDIANAVTDNRVYIDAPHNVEVYLDGNYVGVSPVNFTKVTGDHTITLSKSGYVSKSYTIYLYNDGQDITYSFSDLEPEYDEVANGNNKKTSSNSTSQNKTGIVLFSVSPAGATVRVDDRVINVNNEIELPYGTHYISIKADGYQTKEESFIVRSGYAERRYTLEKQETVSGNDIPNIVTNNKIFVNAPQGVTVQVDGNYVGTSPISFTKVTGQHTITLSKVGYQTMSYKIYLYNDGRDTDFSFDELIKEEGNTDPPSDSKPSISSGSTENPKPPAGSEGTEKPEPSTSSGGTENPKPPTSSGGTENPKPPTSSGGTENPQPPTSSGGTENPHPPTSSGGTENPEPPTSSGGTENPDISTSLESTENPKPSVSSDSTQNPDAPTSSGTTTTPDTSTNPGKTVVPGSSTGVTNTTTSTNMAGILTATKLK